MQVSGNPFNRHRNESLLQRGQTREGELEAEVDEYSAEVLIVLLKAVVLLLDIGPGEEPKHVFLKLAAPLAWDDFDKPDLLFYGLRDNVFERFLDFSAVAINIMEIERQLCHRRVRSGSRPLREPGPGPMAE